MIRIRFFGPRELNQEVFSGARKLDQSFKFISYKILASTELKFRPRQRKREPLGGSDMPREVDELHLNEPDHNPTDSELLLERCVATESEPCSTENRAIQHRGNSCEAVRNSDESSVQFLRRSYSYRRKEVE